MMDQEYLIIRNSKSAALCTPSNTTNNESSIPNNTNEDQSTTFLDDEAVSSSLHINHDASLSIVRLVVESSEGKYMLDFGHKDDDLDLRVRSVGSLLSLRVCTDPIVTSFLAYHTTEQTNSDSDDCKLFIESQSLKHLQVYAELAEAKLPQITSLLDDESDVQPSCLQHRFQRLNKSFHLLPGNSQELLHTLLPLEKLFSWSTLNSARKGGYLHWKDIRNFVAEVKRSIPFIAPASDGLLHHIIQTHLTFHQFVSFAKLLEHHLQRLPIVKVKVTQASTLTVDIQLTSDQSCSTTVCVGCLNENKCPPSAHQLKGEKDLFGSWESVQLVAEESIIVRLGGLKEGTLYDTYVHVCRPSSEFPVSSTDEDVINSHFKIETQGHHLIDVFPVFDSMTKEEQRVELLATVKDKSVRLRAQADGLDIPTGVEEKDNETWRQYIDWWNDNLNIRYDFCMRELLFASKDEEVRRNAHQDGIVMSHARSKNQTKRDQWTRAFGSWYYNQEQELTNDSRSQVLVEETKHFQANHSVQTLNLPISEVDDLLGLRPSFALITEVKIDGVDDEEHSDSLGEVLVLQSLHFPQPNVSLPTPPADFTELSSTTSNEDVGVVPSALPVPAQSNAQVSDALKDVPQMPPRPKSTRLTIGVVGQVVSFRHRFLRRLSTRIDACLALTRPKTPSSLRGIALFRAKVRLVMLLQKVSNKPFSSLNDVDIFSYQERDTRGANSAAVTPISEEEEDDDDDDDDSVMMDKAKDHCELRLARHVFRMMRARANEVAAEKLAQKETEKRAQEEAEKRAQEEKTLAAVEAFNSSLLRKCFRIFIEAIKAAKESIEENVPEAVEVEYMVVEDDDSCEFTSHWNSGAGTFCRINRSLDLGLLIDPALLKHCSSRRRIETLDDETLSCMRCAKRKGASNNLYDVPESILRFDDLTEERPMGCCFRNREIFRNMSAKA